jgi:DNA-binding GntR family transcriptional regulator
MGYMATVKSISERGPGVATRSMQIYHQLRKEVLAGVLGAGDRLVRQKIAERFGVSHIPVTEALLRLEHDGLVENLPMYGSRVVPMTPETVREDSILRQAIECQSARLCASDASDTELQALRKQALELDRLITGQPSNPASRDMHMEFHLAIARAAKSKILVRQLEMSWFRRQMHFNFLAENAALSTTPPTWHERLIEAIATRDQDVAEREMREHTSYQIDDILRLMKSNPALARQAGVITGETSELEQ